MDVKTQAHQGGPRIDAREKVKSVVSHVTKISVSELTGEKLIRDDLGVDSMQAIETLAILEKELNIVVDPERAFNVATMDDLFALVEESILQVAAN
jgi:acyl carrier protein